jgi:FkbM family methyltransferase
MPEVQTYPKSYAQWGDDLLVLKFFSGRENCTFLEAGANDPEVLSQTFLLEKNGWTGVLVEPVPSCCQRLREVRTGSQVFQNALGAPEDRGLLQLVIPHGATELAHELKAGEDSAGDETFEAEFRTLNEVLEAAGIQKLTYLSLDLEGMEDRALRGFDFGRYQPELIIVEDRVNHLRTHRLLKRNGYKLVRRNGSNNWYVPNATTFRVGLIDHMKHIRKLYVSMPFRWLRTLSRQFRQQFRTKSSGNFSCE